jgi:heat shock protein HtpX
MLADLAMWSTLFGFGHAEDEEGGHPLAGLLGIIIAPIAAMLIQLAISRSREFWADEMGAHLTHNPLALARALRKLEHWRHTLPMATGNPATAHLFIVNPFTGGGLASLFSTHPPTEARIARLEAMVGPYRQERRLPMA